MNATLPRLACVFAALFVSPLFGAEDFDAAAAKMAAEYSSRVQQASAELNATRQRITDEKAPMLKALHAAEERIVAAEAEITRIETGQAEAKDRRLQLQKEHEATRKNLNYVSTLARDASISIQDGLVPGEEQRFGEPLRHIIQQFDEAPKVTPGQASTDALDLILSRIEQSLGGYEIPGQAILADGHDLVGGTYAFAGPDAFFRTQDGRFSGVVRSREGAEYPILHPLSNWKPTDAEAFFRGQRGTMMADTTGGKALRLKETKGTLLEHIQRGGLVSFAILFVGLVSLVLIAGKIYDVSHLRVGEPQQIEAFLKQVREEADTKRATPPASLGTATRELFATGFEYFESPKELLEEHLWAVLMRLRLHYERRLPMLSVIAVAAPLMGLLGTVTGMVRTFALITVFGTGNAGKLASGISEVLVATELGLIVAIPTLVAHGFLASRIQKKLSLLERYALEFTTAVQTAKTAGQRPAEVS